MQKIIFLFLIAISFTFGFKPLAEVKDKIRLTFNEDSLGEYSSAVMTDDNKYLIVASMKDEYKKNYSIFIFDIKTKKIISLIEYAHNKLIVKLELEGNLLFSYDKSIKKIWNIEAILNYRSDIGGNKEVVNEIIEIETSVKIDDKNLTIKSKGNELFYYIGNKEGKIKKIDNREIDKKIDSYRKQDRYLDRNIFLLFLIKNEYLISISKHGEIILYHYNFKVNKVTPLIVFKEPYKAIKSVSLSDDENYLIVVKKYEIVVYDIFKGEEKARYKDRQIVTSMVFSKDNKYLFTGTNRGYIEIWNLEKNSLIGSFLAHNKAIYSIDINDKYLVSSSLDDKVKLWKLENIFNHKYEYEFVKEEDNNIAIVFFYKKGIKYKSISSNAKIKYIDMNEKTLEFDKEESIKQLEGHMYVRVDKDIEKIIAKSIKENKKIVTISKNKKYILYGESNGICKASSIKENKKTVKLERSNYKVLRLISVQISDDSKLFASSDKQGNIYINNERGKLIKVIKGHDKNAYFIADLEKEKVYEGNYSLLLKDKDDSFGVSHFKYFSKENIIDLSISSINKIKNNIKTNEIITYKNEKDLIIKNMGNTTIDKIQLSVNDKIYPNLISIKKNARKRVSLKDYRNENIKRVTVLSLSSPFEKVDFDVNEVIQPEMSFKNKSFNFNKDEPLEIEISNNTNNPLNDLNISLLFSNKKNMNITLPKTVSLAKYEGKVIPFKIKYNSEEKEQLRAKCRVFSNNFIWESEEFIFTYQRRIKENNSYKLLLLLLISLLIFTIIILFFIFRNSINIFFDEKYLYKVSPFKLKKIKIFNKTLRKLGISKDRIKFVINFVENSFVENNYYRKKLENVISKTNDNRLYLVTLPKYFSLNISHFYFYFTDDVRKIEEIEQKLQITIIISEEKNLREKFREYSRKKKTIGNVIIPKDNEITKLFLSRDVIREVEAFLIRYIRPKEISPFEARFSKDKYIEKKSRAIVYDLTTRKLKNIFIIGRSNSGKSNLLNSIYLKLKYKDIVIKILKKDSYSEVKKIIKKEMKILESDKKIVFIINDIDSWLENKALYPIIFDFKDLTATGNAFFIIAGSWELDRESRYDNSAFSGFAESIEYLGEITKEKARELIEHNMNILNISFEKNNIINDIIINSGRKIDLLNFLCYELLTNININGVIREKDFKEVIENREILENIKKSIYFDMGVESIIFYYMSMKEEFTFNHLKVKLKKIGIIIEPNILKEHLDKLIFKAILLKTDEFYRFRTPIFYNIFFQKDSKQKLNIEINNLLVKEILDNPKKLYDYTYYNLSTIYRKLENAKQMDYVLNYLEIEQNSFKIVKDAFDLNNDSRSKLDRLMNLFSNRLDGDLKKKNENFEINLNDFLLNIEKFTIHFTNSDGYEKIRSELNKNSINIIINLRSIEIQNKFNKESLNKSDLFIAPTSKDITRLFLTPNPKKLILKIFSKHLSYQHISPYQVGDGIKNESRFFGRTQIIKDIIEEQPKSYIIIGARQVGKTSLLNALARKYKNNNDLEVIQFTLAGKDLEQKIIDELKYRKKDIELNSFRDVKLYLKSQKKKHIFLIDEVDDFIKYENKINSSILNGLREMSSEGYAFFILAGFWQLYQAKYNYGSPILNFGEWIEIGELEEEACRNLIIEPMRIMNIKFKDDNSVNKIIYEMGQKAYLISLVCKKIVTNNKLKIEKVDGVDRYIVDHNYVDKILEDTSIKNELMQWKRLDEIKYDTDEGHDLRKIIVYYVSSDNKSFTLEDIKNFLDSKGINIYIDELLYNLDFLVLSFIFRNDAGNYLFRIPKQKTLLLRDKRDFRIKTYIEEYKKKYLDI